MPDHAGELAKELARLLALITQARSYNNSELAELLTDAAAKCLVKLAALRNMLSEDEPQPVLQQQQQTQPRKKDIKEC